MASEKETTRVQIELPKISYERLLHLKNTTEATSHAEVVKSALRVYERIVAYQNEGCRVILEDPDGQKVELVILI